MPLSILRGFLGLRHFFTIEPAIFWQDAAQRRHASAHCSMFASPWAIWEQASAQALQIFEQTPHTSPWKWEVLSIKSAQVTQICAQSRSNRM